MRNIFHRRLIYSIKSKVFLIFIFLVVLPSLLIIGNFTRNYSDYVLKSIIKEKKTLMKEMDNNMDLQFSNYKNVSMSLYYNALTKSYIDRKDYNRPDEYIPIFLSSIVNSEKYVSAAVLEINGKIYYAGYQYRNLEQYLKEHREDVIQRKGKIKWIPTENLSASFSQSLHNFTLARAVNSPDQSVGTLWLFISEDLLNYMLRNSGYTTDGSNYYIVAPDYHVVTSNDKSMIGKVQKKDVFTQALTKKSGYFKYYNPETDKNEIIVCTSSSTTGWTILTITEEDSIFKDVDKIKELAILIIFLYILFFVFAYYLMSKAVFNKVEHLSKGLVKVSKGSFDKIEMKNSNDEMGMLISTYNYMINKIELLMEDIRLEEQAKNNEKMKVLSMQIGPHFVYNTLNTIKWMAVVNKQKNIQKMIESLIKLMMSVTYDTNEEITLAQEIDLLNSYVYIQKMRFMNFEIEYEMEEEIKNYSIMKLILQPFVENCILHAFTEEPKLFVIHIKAYTDKALYIEIRDNGKGFETESLATRSMEKKDMDHIGIENVMERIRLSYGNEYWVTINSTTGEGTSVMLKLPLLYKKEANADAD